MFIIKWFVWLIILFLNSFCILLFQFNAITLADVSSRVIFSYLFYVYVTEMVYFSHACAYICDSVLEQILLKVCFLMWM